MNKHKQTQTDINKDVPENIVEGQAKPASDFQSPHSYALAILYAMNRLGKHIYEGTVPGAVVTQRRKANKVARKQRKINNHNGSI